VSNIILQELRFVVAFSDSRPKFGFTMKFPKSLDSSCGDFIYIRITRTVYIYIYICIYICIYIYVYIYMYTYICIYMYLYPYLIMYLNFYYVGISVYVCLYICVYARTFSLHIVCYIYSVFCTHMSKFVYNYIDI
jgi:hypothetical protein